MRCSGMAKSNMCGATGDCISSDGRRVWPVPTQLRWIGYDLPLVDCSNLSVCSLQPKFNGNHKETRWPLSAAKTAVASRSARTPSPNKIGNCLAPSANASKSPMSLKAATMFVPLCLIRWLPSDAAAYALVPPRGGLAQTTILSTLRSGPRACGPPHDGRAHPTRRRVRPRG